MQTAIVIPRGGLYPLGGVVDGVDQMSAFRNKGNELKGGSQVVIAEKKEAVVTTFGGFHDETRLPVVSIEGKTGWYLASAFKL